MKSKKLGIALLIMLAFVLTTGTFAYWASSVAGPANDNTIGTVTVGTGKEVTTSFTLSNDNASGGDLVPASQINNSTTGAVDNVVLTYNVAWIEDAATSQLAGTTSTAPITVTPVVTLKDSSGTTVTDSAVLSLIVVTPGANATSLTLADSSTLFTYTITMNEPANQAQYDLIASGTVTITFTYSLGAVATTDN